jgi:hypothetical protein
MKVEDTYFIRCVIGVNKNHGNGQDLWQTHGELQEILVTIGNHLLGFWINKLDYKNMQAKEDGMILICYR